MANKTTMRITKSTINTIFIIIFIIMSIYICHSLLHIDFSNYSGYEHEGTSPTIETARLASRQIYPYVISYIVLLATYFLIGVKGYNKIVFPITEICATITIIMLGIARDGSSFGWLLIVIMPISIYAFMCSVVVGWVSDTNQKKLKQKNKKNVTISNK